MKKQSGFTLIELVMVIVILGVLAAVAIPKFVDLKGDAQQSTAAGVAGAAASASAINYGGCSITNNVSTANKCFTVNTCTSIKQALSGGVWPTGFDATTATPSSVNGTVMTCTLTNSTFTISPTQTFQVIAAGN